jgi:UDP-N-acetylmuramoyl-tripeptide--D-alanyl-D-alanine ligase
MTFGRAESAAVRVVGEVVETAQGIRFTVEIGGVRQALRMVFVGSHNVTNALAAVATGSALGLSLPEIAAGLEAARPVKGRCVWRQADGVRILDDTYNANPASVQAALETALAHRRDSRLVVVLGDMLELGPTSEAAHRDVGRQIAALGAGLFVAMGPQMRTAVDAARQHGLAEAFHAATFEDAVAHLLKRVASGDLVLVKGSRGMRMERIADALAARLSRTEER